MVKRPKLSKIASIANRQSGGRLSAPSALRNADAIMLVCRDQLPKRGRVLEIASGTGEHILKFGHRFPGLEWQPSEIDAERRASIQSWQSSEGSENVLPPIELDATVPGWSEHVNGYSAIYLSNLLHLISKTEAETVVDQAAHALAPGGVCLFYGPFKRGDNFASDSDRAFHQNLTAQDPDIGYKSFQQVQDWQTKGCLTVDQPIEMPANNLMLVARKPI